MSILLETRKFQLCVTTWKNHNSSSVRPQIRNFIPLETRFNVLKLSFFPDSNPKSFELKFTVPDRTEQNRFAILVKFGNSTKFLKIAALEIYNTKRNPNLVQMQQTELNSDVSTPRYNSFRKAAFWNLVHEISSFGALDTVSKSNHN